MQVRAWSLRAFFITLAAVLAAGSDVAPALARHGKGSMTGSGIVTGGLALSVRARALVPGEAVRILVGAARGARDARIAPPLASVSGTFLGETLTFAPDGPHGDWSAWTVVGFDEKAGLRTLAVDAKDATGGALHAATDVAIRSKRFPTENLTVKEEYVEPPPEVQTRIIAETKRLAAIYAMRTPSTLAGSPFARPVPGASLGTFGARRILNGKPRSPHPGLDLRAAQGTPVQAAGPGRVALASELYFSGNTVIVDHGAGLFTLYAHLSRMDVKEGEAIAQGTQVGLSGATGRVTGPHLHWGAKIGERPFDPTALLDKVLFE